MKVLSISSNCFSETNSNGRIFGRLFQQISRDNIAEFYVTDGVNDFGLCSNYYHFSDKDALLSIFKKCRGRRVTSQIAMERVEKVSKFRQKFGRSSLMMICREIIWSLSNWWNEDLKEWLNLFEPDVVVLQCGDIPFFYKIATKIAIERNIPIVLFNTEISYFVENKSENLVVFSLYRYLLRKAMRKALNLASISIYNSLWLKEKFDSEFCKPSKVIYQSSDLKLQAYHGCPSKISVVYTGNLSWGRCYPLADIARVLLEMNDEYAIDVYGIVEDQDSLNVLHNTPGLRYHGVVPYNEVKRVISQASILVVAENTDEKYSRHTNYGFSGKITDCLFSGIPILAYGPLTNVGIKYLKDNNAAQYVSSKDKLEVSIREILLDDEKRKYLVHNAQKIAEENHDSIRNSIIFKEILEQTCKKWQ